MKKNLILILLGMLTAATASAGDIFEADGLWYEVNDDGNTLSVVKKPDSGHYTGDVVIPSTVSHNAKEYTVTEISPYAFRYNEATSVKIPDTVTLIGTAAFEYGSNLTEVNFGNSVATISNLAFASCTGLTSVSLPESLVKIGNSAFTDCTGLTEITIPESVEVLDYSVFSGCHNLSAFHGKFASDDHRCLVAEGVLMAFAPAGITVYHIPATVKEIKSYLFAGLTNLTLVTIPGTVTSIGGAVFQGCTSLQTVTIPSSVKTIWSQAFYDCDSLKAVTLDRANAGDFSLGSEIFGGTTPIKECTLLVPKDCYSNYSGAAQWRDFGTIREMKYDFCAFNDDFMPIYYNFNGDDMSVSVTCSDSEAFNSYSGNVIIPEMVEYEGNPYHIPVIGDNAFIGCPYLTSVTIPGTIVEIGNFAFSNCPQLTSMEIPSSVKKLGKGCFAYCESLARFEGNYVSADSRCLIDEDLLVAFAPAGLTEYIVPDGVTEIGTAAFAYNPNLTMVILPSTLTTISYIAFMDCKGLASIVIPKSVNLIDYNAFTECTGLTTVVAESSVPSNITLPGSYPFTGLYNTATLYVPKGCEAQYREINGWDAFKTIIEMEYDFCQVNDHGTTIYYNFDSEDSEAVNVTYRIRNQNRYTYIGSVEIPATVSYMQDTYAVTTIGEMAFASSEYLTTVNLPSTVTHIDRYAFAGSDMMTMTIPASVTYIGESAFQECDSFEVFTVFNEDPANIQLGDDVFFLSELDHTTLYVPYGCKEKYEVAPQWKDFAPRIVELDARIDSVASEGAGVTDPAYYDLTGRRVAHPSPGIYIHQGKKILIKE